MTLAIERDIATDEHWAEYAHDWLIRPDTTYLNHGSFGPPPHYVRLKRRQYLDQLDSQPMDFFVRHWEQALCQTRDKLSQFVGTAAENIVLVENATFGMNVIANSISLATGANLLLNNHEYGAVMRLWNTFAERQGGRMRIAQLPRQFESQQQIVDCLVQAADDQTQIVVVSQITSPTGLIMPVKQICAAFRDRGIAVIVDGPHAPAQIDLRIDELGCDFYTASCHKWLSASFGSGFLYVHPRWQHLIRPIVQSWGRLRPAVPDRWDQEFIWSGTRDPSCFLSIADAIDYLQQRVGLEAFQRRTRFLAASVESMLCQEFGSRPIADRRSGWYGSMALVPLPQQDCSRLQAALWHEYQIEVPIIHFDDRWFVRVSCHLYNTLKQLETLHLALRKFFV